MKPDPDRPDVEALQAGEDAALDRLMQRHHLPIQAFIHRMIGNGADAEELAQETFVRAYFQIRSYRPRAPFVAWLYQIARNLCRDYFRSRAYRQRRNSTQWTPEIDAAADPYEPPAPDPEQTARLRQAMARLPIPLRECIVLTAIEGLSHKEAAARLGLTPKAVEVKTYRARKRLLKLLSEDGSNPGLPESP